MVDKLNEFELISNVFGPLAADAPGSLNLSDDAAIISPSSDQEVVVTADTIVEGVHFRSEDPPETVGVKALGVNLSDLAAMGASPHGYTLSALGRQEPPQRGSRNLPLGSWPCKSGISSTCSAVTRSQRPGPYA